MSVHAIILRLVLASGSFLQSNLPLDESFDLVHFALSAVQGEIDLDPSIPRRTSSNSPMVLISLLM